MKTGEVAAMTKRIALALVGLALLCTQTSAATCYITEFRQITQIDPSGAQIAAWPAIAKQTVAVGAEAKSAAFNAATRFIRLTCDAIASFDIATSPTATTAMSRIPADTIEYHGVQPGDKISIISNL